jgi:hypothetical protein
VAFLLGLVDEETELVVVTRGKIPGDERVGDER